MEKKILIRVIGITAHSVQHGAYALILGDNTGKRIPVIVPTREAQAIVAKLQNVDTPQPLTHDIMLQSLQAFGITLNEVIIRDFRDGFFHTDIILSDGDRQVEIEARTSDAVALAVRNGAPIYATPQVIEATGFTLDGDTQADATEATPQSVRQEPKLHQCAVSELKKMLAKCIKNEDYERAAEIQRMIKIKTDKYETQQ